MDPIHLMDDAIRKAKKRSDHPFAKFENTKAGPWSLASASFSNLQQQGVAALTRFLNNWGQELRSLTLPTIPAESCPNARMDREGVYACAPCSQGHDCLDCGAQLCLDPYRNNHTAFPSFHNQCMSGTIDTSVPYIERPVVHFEALSDPSEGALLDNIDDVDYSNISAAAINKQDSDASKASDPAVACTTKVPPGGSNESKASDPAVVKFATKVPLGDSSEFKASHPAVEFATKVPLEGSAHKKGEILGNENLEGNRRLADSGVEGVPEVENTLRVKSVSFVSEDEVRVINPRKLSHTYTAKRRRPASSEPETRDKATSRTVADTIQHLPRQPLPQQPLPQQPLPQQPLPQQPLPQQISPGQPLPRQPLPHQRNTVVHTYGAVSPNHCGACGGPDDGSVMVCCDKRYQWFHNRCMGLREVHFKEKWFCPPCRTANPSQLEPPSANQDRSAPRQRHSEPQSTSSQVLTTQKPVKKDKAWEDGEKQGVVLEMRKILEEQQYHKTEKKWEVISDRLMEKYGIDRSGGAVKNYWNRHGRESSGIDERKNKKPDNLVTGVQSPKSRREARKKRKAMENGGEEEGGKEESNTDEDSTDLSRASSPKKRRKYINSRSGSQTVAPPFA